MLRTLITLFVCFMLMVNGQTALERANEAYANMEIPEALLAYEEALAADSSYEALWRYGRALVDRGNMEADNDEAMPYYRQAVPIAEQAIAAKPEAADGYFVKAMAVGRVALAVGGREKVELSAAVKENAMLAIERNPQHDGALHILARWHREVTNLGWFLKTVAEIVYGGLPEASYAEAVQYFKQAIAAKPMHINHHYELGVTYEDMGEKEKAISEYQKVLELTPTQVDDGEIQAQAKARLDDLL
jgi:tetratricopeptide (TPR) repeat protein